ncbi:MAG: hypothetical protein J6T15_01475 [Bacilli bacterium]|nr:hypothetical protein [Bacilli bacterium]
MNNEALTKRNKFIKNVKKCVAFGDEPEIKIIDCKGNEYEMIVYSDFVDFYDEKDNYKKLEKIEDVFEYIKNDIEQYIGEFGQDLTIDRDDHYKLGSCYPKYAYIFFFILAFLMVFDATMPLYLFTDDSLTFDIIFSTVTGICAIVCVICGFFNMQTYVITKEIAIYRFGKEIESINLNDCVFEIMELPTFFSHSFAVFKEKWICLYKRDESYKRFKVGCANKKNSNRIQILYSDDVLNILKNSKAKQIDDFKI